MLAGLALTAAFLGGSLHAQARDRITAAIDSAQTQVLTGHRPAWALAANDAGAVSDNLPLEHLTLVLARSPEQEAAFEQLLKDQQDPASPEFHHWLTPAEVGQRFGLSDNDLATLKGWLTSQGLHVNSVSPSRIFIGFGGEAGSVGRAFQTELHNYKVNGELRMAPASDPMIPQAIAPAVKAVHGLYTIEDRPLSHAQTMWSDAPQVTGSSGSHYIAPGDFAILYDLPAAWTGSGKTIGIVGRSRTDFADFQNFQQKTGVVFANPTEVVPPNGVDPGAAYTAPPGAGVSIDDQSEATLDVLRAGSVAPGANILLVVSTAASGGIGTDAQYLVDTTPVPAQIMNISFGACESSAGDTAVQFWNTLFQQAAAEGISVFVSSGDSGASGCDTHGNAPPSSPSPNSPNYICSSSYVTCVGGTEFVDTASPSQYWNSSNGAGFTSVLSYIPEGAWNDPYNSSTSTYQVAASGGGVSSYIATPTWQTGTGVPAARAGRYTPDIAFSASGHDGYFGCFAAGGGNCVGTSFSFESFGGTSAAAPDMAGITAMLDQKLGSALGNLNPAIYSMAANSPSAFHDVTVATSGVTSCAVSTPSLCNNSIAGPSSLTGGQAGYMVGTGYDEVTGWGSLDVATFLNDYPISVQVPTVTTSAATSVVSTGATLNGQVNPNFGDTHVWFLYGTNSNLSGASQTGSQDIGSGSTAVAVTAPLTGLTPSTTYYFQMVAQNSAGTTNGTILSFTTPAVQAPTATTTAAVSIVPNAASLTGLVNPNGADTHVWFLYETNSNLSGATQTASQDLGSGSTATTIGASLTGLNASTTYYFQIVAQNSAGTTNGTILSFTTTAVQAPTLTSISVTVIGSSGASLDGVVNPNGGDTHVWFLYGTNSNLSGATQTVSQDIGSGSDASPVHASLTGLSGSTTYYFQMVAQNSAGTTSSSIGNFVTAAAPQAPTVTTNAASSITSSSATVNSSVNPNNADTQVWFLYGTSSTLAGASQTSSQDIGSGSIVAVTAPLTGLTAGTTYYFQSVAQNSAGTISGSIVSFTTPAAPTPSFAVSGTAVSVNPGASTGNTSTVTVTPSNGFTGTVTLSAAVTSSPAGAVNPPTFTWSPSNGQVTISGTGSQTAMLTIATTAPTSAPCTADGRTRPVLPWSGGAAALACLILIGIPARRRRWQSLLGAALLCVFLALTATACGGGSSGQACPALSQGGTTAGSYTITVTGTSGSTTQTSTVTLTVN